jgi:hypothetical protein
MNTCAKFYLTLFRFATLGVFINGSVAFSTDCRHSTCTYSTSHVSVPTLPLYGHSWRTYWTSPIRAARWHFCTTACACCCYLPIFTCSKWKEECTKCVLSSPSSGTKEPSLSYSHRYSSQPDLSFGCRSCGFPNCYGASSSVTYSELFWTSLKGTMNSYFLWRCQSAVNMASLKIVPGGGGATFPNKHI